MIYVRFRFSLAHFGTLAYAVNQSRAQSVLMDILVILSPQVEEFFSNISVPEQRT